MPLTVISKIRVPPSAGNVISRDRLAVAWDASPASVVLLDAPAGAGKSTLARQIAAKWAGKLAWYSVDQSENEVERFAMYLVAAIAEVVPRVRQLAASIATENISDLEPILSALLNLLTKAAPLLLIIDDYHVITLPTIHAGMRFFLAHLPSHIKVVITARGAGEIGLPALRARGRLIEIDARELSFTSEEAHEFLLSRLPFAPAPADSANAAVLTEGWATGLQIIALAASRRGEFHVADNAPSIPQQHLWDFFAEEVFDRQPEGLRKFLLATAVVDRFDAALAAELTGQLDVTDYIAQTRKANLFLIALDGQGRWYRYHHLFAEFLKHRLSAAPKDWMLDLHARASDAWLRRDRLDEAVRLALLARDELRVVRLLESHGWTLKIHFRSLADACMEFLPRQTVVRSLELTNLQGWMCFDSRRSKFSMGGLQAIEPLLCDAEQALQTLLPATAWWRAVGVFAVLRAQVAEVREDFPTASKFINTAEQHLTQRDRSYVFVAMISGSLAFREGRMDVAADCYRRAIQLAPQIAHLPALVWSYSRLGNILFLRGSLREAQAAWMAAVAAAKDANMLGERNLLFIYIGLAEVLREFLDLDAADVYLTRAQGLAEQFGQSWMLPIVVMRVRCALTQLHAPSVPAHLQLVDQLLARGDAHSHERMHADEARVNWWVACGNTSALGHWLAINRACEVTIDPLTQIVARTRARGLIVTGAPEQALGLIVEAVNIARDQGYLLDLITGSILLSRCCDALGQPENALAALTEALDVGAQTGALGSFLGLRLEMEVLLAADWAKGRIGDGPFARRVVELIRQRPQRRRTAAARLPALVRAIPLTAAEWKILQRVADGLSNEEIASQLFVELSTVKSHLKGAYRKMGVQSRAQAALQVRALLERLDGAVDV